MFGSEKISSASKDNLDQKPGDQGEIGNEADLVDPNKPLEKMNKTELIEKAKQLVEESKKNYDLFLRSQAEMENLKKRHKKDREDWFKFANESLIKDILPIIDNMERAIEHCEKDSCVAPLKEGVDLTLKGLITALIKSGVEEIKAKGERFDPCFHEALSEIPDENVAPGTVLQEFQKGYILNKRLLRPAKVIVSKSPYTETDMTADPAGICEEKDIQS